MKYDREIICCLTNLKQYLQKYKLNQTKAFIFKGIKLYEPQFRRGYNSALDWPICH